MTLFRVFFVLCIVFGGWHFFSKKAKSPTGSAGKSAMASSGSLGRSVVLGHYVMQNSGSPTLSLKFLDDKRVQMLGNGAPWGANEGMCTYKVTGEKLLLTHACGVWNMDIKGDVLYQTNNGWSFRRSNK